jgi:nicotinate-nucleotide adenylyltransferase
MHIDKPIGLLLGSFNPMHNGHLFLAEQALKSNQFKCVWFVIHKNNDFKNQPQLASPEDRLQMVKLTIMDNPNYHALSTKHATLLGALDDIKKNYPDQNFAIIFSQDLERSLASWRDYQKIISTCKIFAYKAYKSREQVVVSSDLVRQAIAKKQNVSELLPEPVLDYILKNNLYSL